MDVGYPKTIAKNHFPSATDKEDGDATVRTDAVPVKMKVNSVSQIIFTYSWGPINQTHYFDMKCF